MYRYSFFFKFDPLKMYVYSIVSIVGKKYFETEDCRTLGHIICVLKQCTISNFADYIISCFKLIVQCILLHVQVHQQMCWNNFKQPLIWSSHLSINFHLILITSIFIIICDTYKQKSFLQYSGLVITFL